MKDDELHQLLHQRHRPPVSSGLAERIIRASLHVPQKQSLWQWVCGLLEEFHSPKPAYAFASLLLLGVFIGWTAPEEPLEPGRVSQVAVQDYLYADEEML